MSAPLLGGRRGGGFAWAAGWASVALVPLPHVERDGMHRPDLLGALDVAVLDGLPDRPSRNAKFFGSFLHQHVRTLHSPDGTETSCPVIDYRTGQFSDKRL